MKKVGPATLIRRRCMKERLDVRTLHSGQPVASKGPRKPRAWAELAPLYNPTLVPTHGLPPRMM